MSTPTVSKDVNKLAKMKLPSLLEIRSVIISCGAAVFLAGEQVKRIFSPKEGIIVQDLYSCHPVWTVVVRNLITRKRDQ